MPLLGGYKAPINHVKTDAVSSTSDKSAVNYGNEYRGVGVFIGMLGIAIVFVAITPGAFEINNILWLRLLGILKVFMMCLMLTLVYLIGQKSGFKDKWINSRLKSEKDRYFPLEDLIAQLIKDKSEKLTTSVKTEALRILQGHDGQIEYNHNKAQQYESIEKAVERISWIGFFVALVCAVLILLSEFDLIHHQSFLILGTAFLPALVGGLHGINGFLTVGNLAGDHKTMTQHLTEAECVLQEVSASDADEVLKIAKKTHLRLDGRDIEWGEKTQSGPVLTVG